MEERKAQCLVCEKTFTAFPSYIANGRAKYCSKQCGYASLRKHPKGKKECTSCKKVYNSDSSNFYKNASKNDRLTTECIRCLSDISFNRTSKKRKDFIESRENKCAKCGFGNKNYLFFDIDHIVPLSTGNKKRNQYDYSEPDNLQVLCPNCHRNKTLKEFDWRFYGA